LYYYLILDLLTIYNCNNNNNNNSGNLPPETRRLQAEIFNNNNNNNILVATDAIGMGLNLNIRRIIFCSLMKYDGNIHRKLFPSEVKQIAGRAGRFSLEYSEEGGIVTTFHEDDIQYLKYCLDVKDEDIKEAG